MTDLRRVNLHELVPEYDDSDPEGYRAGMARFGPAIGASQMGASVYELPPGQSICPYHYEYPARSGSSCSRAASRCGTRPVTRCS